MFLMWYTPMVVSLFSCSRGRCFSDFLVFYWISTRLHSGYWNLLHILPASSLLNQPNLHGGDTSFLLCSVDHPFCHVTCFTICVLGVILSVSSEVQKKYWCVNGDYTSLLLCFFKPLFFYLHFQFLSFMFNCRKIIIYKRFFTFSFFFF